MSGNSTRSERPVLLTDSASGGSGENTTTLDFGGEMNGLKVVSPNADENRNDTKTWGEQDIDEWRVLGSVQPEEQKDLTEAEDLRAKILGFFKKNYKHRKRYDRFLKYDFDFVRKMTTDIKLNLRALNSLLGEK